MTDLESISGLSETYVESMIDNIKSQKVKLAAILIADCGLRLKEAANLFPGNLVFGQDGKLEAIQGLKHTIQRSLPGTRTIKVNWLKSNGLLSDKHEQEINQILKTHQNYKVSTRTVELTIKSVSSLHPSDLHAYFIFRLLRRRISASTIFWIFDTNPFKYGEIVFKDELRLLRL